jgi:CHAT domain-containing protein
VQLKSISLAVVIGFIFQGTISLNSKLPAEIWSTQVLAQDTNFQKGIAARLLEEGNSQFDDGQFELALDSYRQAWKIYQSIETAKKEQSRTLIGLGLVYNALGDHKQAINYYKQSLAIAHKMGYREEEGESLHYIGEAFFASGNLASAQTNVRSAVAIWEAIDTEVKKDDYFHIFTLSYHARSYQLLQKILIAQNQTNQALEVAEQGRARALAELLYKRQGLTTSNQPLHIQHIRQIAQQENATLVEYSIAWNDLYVWVIKPNGQVIFHKVDLENINLENISKNTIVAAAYTAEGRGNSVITALVSSTRDSVNTTGTASSKITQSSCQSNNCLQQMHDLLIKPIVADLPTNPNSLVIFIPYDSLFLIPFAALQDENRKFFIEKHTLTISPSIQVLALTHTEKAQLPSTKSQNLALVVGNPIMPKVGGQQLPQLPGAEIEAKAIAQLLKTQPLIGGQATKAAVKQGMLGARFIHLATHALLNKQIPGGIYGKVALAPSGKDDGFLGIDDVAKLPLTAELAVLSACNTGRGKITVDGVMGLSRAFISAGVPSVVVSLWTVADGSTAKLMQEFYIQLEQHQSKAQALRQAILKTKQYYPQPKNWAPFLLIGESK